ncbi:DUF4376 domain-containing protein [Pseudomonas fluorescens]|uniref:DUF4376 domain-containing protein n=1 Tax=Pseudomonas fluorescens TaxID=294 RepID=UPI00209A64F1|nr:DUF4376 domain-containing protein [Pseudomonas fluorescens]MCO7625467.1 DUF4376 domain-containing protein [Pseudomonas fluorescens]
MKYAIFNENFELCGRYDSATHEQIPEGALEIPDDLYFKTIRENDGIWMLVEGSVVKQPFPAVAPNWPMLIANERFRREASGVNVEGLLIESTRDSQALIASTGLSAILDPEYRCNFKTLNGFVEIGAEQILAIAKAVRAHVQACFDRELELLRAIQVGSYTEEMLEEGWPDSLQATSVSAPQ